MSFLRRIFNWLKASLLIIWLLLMTLIGAKLTYQNPQVIDLDLIFWNAPSTSVGVVLSVSLVVGVLLGIMAMVPILVLTKMKLRRAVDKARKLSLVVDQPVNKG